MYYYLTYIHMRTMIFSVHVPKNTPSGYVKDAVNKMFKTPLAAASQKIKEVTSRMYSSYTHTASPDEVATRLTEEQEHVQESKQVFREIEQMKDLEYA